MIKFSRLLILACLPFLATIIACEGDTIVGSQQTEGIQVTGTGSESGVPDVVILNLGVVVEDKEIEKARVTAADAMQKLLDSLKGNGVDEKDIKTLIFNIYPVYDYNYTGTTTQQTLRGYQVTNIVSVKVRDIDKSGKVIDDAVAAGDKWIRVNSISFDIDDKETLKEKAREKAMKDANDKAQTLAQLGGVKLGEPIFISESLLFSPDYSPYYSRSLGGEEAALSTSIAPGQLEITVTVSVIYAIE